MADSSATRVRRLRAHRNGQHGLCDPEKCAKARTLELDASKCVTARAVLDHLRATGIPWERLGSELPKLRAEAKFPLENYPELAEQHAVDSVIEMEARHLATFLIDNAG